MQTRVKKIFKNIKNDLDAIIIKNFGESSIDKNFFYFTNIEQGLFEGSIAILYPDGNISLVISELELELAKKIKADFLVYKNKEEYLKNLKNCLKNTNNIGLNYNSIPYSEILRLKKEFNFLKLFDISKELVKTRRIKDYDEIQKIRDAVKISDYVGKKIPDLINSGMYEYELAAEINYLMQKKGAEKPAFDTISSFGENTSKPHYTHGDKKLCTNDIVLCDFGACYKRYNSDMTRTFFYKKAESKQKEMYEVVLNAQKKAFENISPGVKANKIHEIVDSYINKTKFKGCFIHSTGHSLGLDVHDGGVSFSSESDVKLEKNMVLTVEPGVYISGYGGIRIEDDVLITDEGIEILSKTNRDLKIV